MKKLLAAAVCAAALVGCGGPLDESDPSLGAQQQQLVMPDSVPTGGQLDPQQLRLNPTQDQVRQGQADFADQHVWGVTERPHHCGGH